jgi:hypothetical protein
MFRLVRWALMILGVAVIVGRAKKAQQVYVEAVSSGSKPIEAVGTAVAAFIGIAPGSPLNESENGAAR